MTLIKTCAAMGFIEKLPGRKCAAEQKNSMASIPERSMTKHSTSVVMGSFIIKQSHTKHVVEDTSTTTDPQQLAVMAYSMTGDANFAAMVKRYITILGDITKMEGAAV